MTRRVSYLCDGCKAERDQRGTKVDRTELVEDFKNFLKENDDLVREHSVRIEDIPPDNDWILDSEWDEIYRQEVANKKHT